MLREIEALVTTTANIIHRCLLEQRIKFDSIVMATVWKRRLLIHETTLASAWYDCISGELSNFIVIRTLVGLTDQVSVAAAVGGR